jgi:predicted N-acetyltransferase YhbS
VLGLGPLGVRPARQRSGVGTVLVHALLAVAEAAGEQLIALLGSPDYYRRFGFLPAAPLGVRPPEPAWGAPFQLRRLSAWDDGLAGAFRYAPAFDRL